MQRTSTRPRTLCNNYRIVHHYNNYTTFARPDCITFAITNEAKDYIHTHNTHTPRNTRKLAKKNILSPSYSTPAVTGDPTRAKETPPRGYGTPAVTGDPT